MRSSEYQIDAGNRGTASGLARLLRSRAKVLDQWPDDREYELHVEAREVRE